MDKFKKENIAFVTANDLNAKCVRYKNKTRRSLMKRARKIARKNLKFSLDKCKKL